MNFTIIHRGKEPKIGDEYIIASRTMKVKSVKKLNGNKFKVTLISPKGLPLRLTESITMRCMIL